MKLLTQYRLDAVDRQLETIHPEMLDYFPEAFPKSESRWISEIGESLDIPLPIRASHASH